MMTGKFFGILFGLMMMVGLSQGLWCHRCESKKDAACDAVEAGKNSSFSIKCPENRVPENRIELTCKSQGVEGTYYKHCYQLHSDNEKVGCIPNPNAPGTICTCTGFNCNGKNATNSAGTLAAHNKPNKNNNNLFIILFSFLFGFFVLSSHQ